MSQTDSERSSEATLLTACCEYINLNENTYQIYLREMKHYFSNVNFQTNKQFINTNFFLFNSFINIFKQLLYQFKSLYHYIIFIY